MSNYAFTPERRELARQRALAKHAAGKTRDPSPEEIAAGCREIQSTWSTAEERSRRPTPQQWTLAELRVVDFCGG